MTEWWRGAVLYQIWPRSFADSDGNGIGDLRGVVSRLEYLANLGVEGIWLSPFFTSPMADYGYDVADYCDVDPTFGTLADFDELLAEAHTRNLKIIIDQVYSHSSDQHAWFQESRQDKTNRKADWYVWADAKEDGSPPNNWLSVFGGSAWTWDTRRRQYYLHNFLAEQPDLNFHNPDVQDAMLNVARFWLDRGVDGFRLDVANYFFHDAELRDNPAVGSVGHARPSQFQEHLYERSRPETLGFIKRLRALLNDYEGRMAVAEIDSTQPTKRSIAYTENKVLLHTAYNFQFLRADQLTASLIRDTVEEWEATDAWPSWSFSNHDVRRAVTRWGGQDGGAALARQLLTLLCCLRGTVFLYQGDELGLPQADLRFEDLRDPEAIRFWPEDLGRDGARTPMPWTATEHHAGFTAGTPWMNVDEKHKALAADLQEKDETSALYHARAIIAFRRQCQALRRGTIAFDDRGASLLVFTRIIGDEEVWCAFNLSNETVTVDTPFALKACPGTTNAALSKAQVILAPRGGFVGMRKPS
ncbi:MAG: alpha-amylase family glycosyl hydrolase [Pseudomonadota bacterium]